MEIILKPTKDTKEKTKVTLSLPHEIYELYRQGKNNGWDTTDTAVQAITKTLIEKRDQLLIKRNRAV